MPSLDFTLPTTSTPASAAGRASSASAPKKPASRQPARGGKDFDALMSQISDAPDREPERTGSPARAASSTSSAAGRDTESTPRDKKDAAVTDGSVPAAAAQAATPAATPSSTAGAWTFTLAALNATAPTSDDGTHDASEGPDAAATAGDAAAASAQAIAGATALALATTGASVPSAAPAAKSGDAGKTVGQAATPDAAPICWAPILPGADGDEAGAGTETDPAAPPASASAGKTVAEIKIAVPVPAIGEIAAPVAPAPDAAALQAGAKTVAAPAVAASTVASGAAPQAADSAAATTVDASVTPPSAAPAPDAAKQQAVSALNAAFTRQPQPAAQAAGQPTVPAPARAVAGKTAANAPAATTTTATATTTATTNAPAETSAAATVATDVPTEGPRAAAVSADAAATPSARASERAPGGRPFDPPAAAANDTTSFIETIASGGADTQTAGRDGSSRGSSAQGGAQAFTLPSPQTTTVDVTAAAAPATGLGSVVAPAATEPGSAASLVSPPTAIASAASAADASAQQIIRGMRLQWSGSVGEAQLRLQPENLGQVLVSVRVDQGTVSATFRADSATAQQWIQTHQQDLKQALQDQGLQVSEIIVTNEPDQRQQRGSQQERETASRARQARRQNSTADQPRFEIRV